MALDTQVPAWLERNWSPKPTFDPTPWLQDRYARQIDEKVIPLKIQGLELANRANQLHIEQQAMENEQAGIEMDQYRQELPAVTDYMKASKGDPLYFQRVPPPSVTNPKLQQMLINAQHVSAMNTYAQNVQKYEAGLTEAAAHLVLKGKYVKPDMDDKGQAFFDPQKLAAAASDLDEADKKFVLDRIKAQATARAGAGSALVANMGLLETYEQEYSDALDMGDQAGMDKAQKKIDMVHDAISRTHRDIKLESEIRLNERLINTLTAKIASEIIPTKKAEMQTRLDSATTRYKQLISDKDTSKPFAPPLTTPTGATNYIWTPQGTKPK